MKKSGKKSFDPARLPFYQAESAVDSKNLDFFKYAIEVAADEVFLMQSDSGIVYVNQSACNRLGYTSDELVGMKVWQWDPLFQESAWPGFWEDFVDKKHLHFETQHRTKFNEIFPVEIHAHYFAQDNEEFLLAFVNDLSEKRRLEQENIELVYREKEYAENALLERSRELEEAQRLAHLGSWQLKIKENQLSWSPEIFKIFEIDPARFEASYEAFLNCIHPDDRDHVNQAFTESVTNKKPYLIKHRLQFPDGRIKWVEERGETHYDANGEPELSRGTVTDITQEVKYQHEIKEHHKRLENIIWGTNVGTWEWNIETGETVFNEKWAEIIGYKLEELAPTSIETWMEFSHPDDLEKSGAELKKVFSKELQYYECEVRMKHKSGRWVWVLDRGSVIEWNEDGSPRLMSGTHLDITDRKNYEQDLQSEVIIRTQELSYALEKAEVANQEKSRFLANMSHELRTPMHSILSFTSLGEKKTQEAKSAKYFGNIKQSATRLMSLIDGLLDISKLEAGKIDLDYGLHELSEIIKTQVEGLSGLLQDKNLTISLKAVNEAKALFDEKSMTQVIVNLLSNAIKYSSENTAITLKSGTIEVMHKGTLTDCVFFSVTDEGVGIPPEEVDVVFDRFVESTHTKSKAGGSGLGLSISKEIIKLHKGMIWAESPPRDKTKGSCFTFQFPVGFDRR